MIQIWICVPWRRSDLSWNLESMIRSTVSNSIPQRLRETPVYTTLIDTVRDSTCAVSYKFPVTMKVRIASSPMLSSKQISHLLVIPDYIIFKTYMLSLDILSLKRRSNNFDNEEQYYPSLIQVMWVHCSNLSPDVMDSNTDGSGSVLNSFCSAYSGHAARRDSK